MSTPTNRDSAPGLGGTVDRRLARLLDTPLLASVVPHLAPETLHGIVQYRGLEACGELLTSATPAQLTALLDLDLWRPAHAGRDEQFSAERFGEWLEVLVDAGDSVAARTVARLDTKLVISGLSRYVRVFDPGIFEPTAQSDDEGTDRHDAMREGDRHARVRDPGDDGLECELGGYLVRARRADAWDAIVTLLGALETEYVDSFQRIMQGCRSLSNSRPEIDGLDDLLMAPEQQLHEVAIGREQRRSRRGHTSPADARAFLQLARQGRRTPGAAASLAIALVDRAGLDSIGSEADTACEGTAPGPVDGAPDRGAPNAAARSSDGMPSSIAAVVELLAEAGLMPGPPRRLLEAANEVPGAPKLTCLRRLMEFLLHHDEPAYLSRSRELAFLANALLAGCSVQSRPFTPTEASDAAACVCNLGLERWDAQELPDAFLVDHDLLAPFETGWSALYEDVSLFAADSLLSTLAALRPADADIDRDLHRLRRQLATQRKAGTPWLSRHAADVLAILDTTAWAGVLGLLDECPIVPAALTSVLERRTTSVSATAFEFISTNAQIGDIRVFMRTLPSVLSR